jgi:hypothetical protein
MSFIDDIVDIGSTALKYLGGNTLGSTLARTALTGFVLTQVSKSLNKDNNKDLDKGNRLQVNPSTDTSIPVVYGDAHLGGKIIDARLSADNKTMWYCLVLSEKTGNIFSTSAASQITFEGVYRNQLQVEFQGDGVTVSSFSDEDGNISTKPNGLIRVYPFSGGSNYPVSLSGYASGNTTNAYTLFPDWTTSHLMSDLVFAIIRIDYDRTNEVTDLGDFTFHLKNTMKQPGDVMYDYMTNTRYGAGIDPTEIYSS